MEPDPFDEIGQLIEAADRPFPVALVRQLLSRATARTKVTRDLATALGHFQLTIAMLEELVSLDGRDTRPKRQAALDDLSRLRALCRLAAQH